MAPSRGALLAVTAAAAASVALVGCDGSGSDHGNGPETSRAASSRSPTPSPTRSYPLSKAPRAIPAVREHTAAHGPGWKPGKDSGVVIADGSGKLADEGKLLAGELKIHYRGEVPARAGDVELALTPKASGGPESYTLRTADGRVRISGPGEAGVFYGTRTLKQYVRADVSIPE
ncbi:glycoside hydrolase family 20 zincin-like fold domain-containing protein, partial [Streptomyces sp. DT225]